MLAFYLIDILKHTYLTKHIHRGLVTWLAHALCSYITCPVQKGNGTNSTSAMRLHSADSLIVMRPRTRLKFGGRGFSAAAPDAWNSLPTHVKSAPSLDAFTDRLKTELFRRSYA